MSYFCSSLLKWNEVIHKCFTKRFSWNWHDRLYHLPGEEVPLCTRGVNLHFSSLHLSCQWYHNASLRVTSVLYNTSHSLVFINKYKSDSFFYSRKPQRTTIDYQKITCSSSVLTTVHCFLLQSKNLCIKWIQTHERDSFSIVLIAAETNHQRPAAAISQASHRTY